jgi:hypothetical protein
LNEEIRKIVLFEEETKAEEEIAKRRSEIADNNAKTAPNTKGADSSREKGPPTNSPSYGAESSRSMDSNHVDAFFQEPIMVTAPGVDGEKNTDDVPGTLKSDEAAVTRRGRMEALVKGIDLMAFFQSLQYRVVSLLAGPTICFWIIA